MAQILVIVAAFMLFAVGPLVSATSEGCLVHKYVEIKEPADAHILSFIKLDKPLHFIVQFKDQDLTFIRDWVELTNSRMMQAKVRGGTSNKTTHDLPLVFGEGWNKLHLQAVHTHFQLTQFLGDDDEATLLNLQLDYPISSVHVEGTFALCSEGSPEWKVEVGQEVTVPLQPETNQQLQVIGLGSADPYLLVPSANSDLPKDIRANTTLTIKTRRRRSLITVEVFQEYTQDDGQALVDTNVASSPTVLMGVRSGAVHLRLDLSVPTTTDDSPSQCSAGTSTPLWPIGCALLLGAMIFGMALGLLVSWLCNKRKAKKTIPLDVASFPCDCEKRTKRKGEKAATPDAANFPSAHKEKLLPV